MSRIQGKDFTDSTTAYAGIDVCKAWLDVHVLGAGRDEGFRVANDAAGIGELLARLDGIAIGRALLEATGRMHHAVWAALDGAGIAVVEINPYRARKFADVVGQLAKTDAIDARLLAMAAASLQFAPTPPKPQNVLRLRELQALRRNLVGRRVALANQRAAATDATVRNILAAETRLVERHIARIEAELLAEIKADPEMARAHAILVSIPGIGPTSAAALVIELPELGKASGKQIAALVGVAPMNCDSGPQRGQRHTKGGRAPLRAALQMAALAAARANPSLRAFRNRLRDKGKPHRKVLTAVLRKLLVLANTLVAQDRLWTPTRP